MRGRERELTKKKLRKTDREKRERKIDRGKLRERERERER